MASIKKPKCPVPFSMLQLFSLAWVVLVFYPLAAKSHDATTANLLTSFDVGKLSSKIAITGTVYNPLHFKLRFEAISALLSLFDLQEKVNSQVQIINSTSEGSGVPVEEDYSTLSNMQILLESVIQDSCNYINWTLADFYIPASCGDFTLAQETFNCSREAAEALQLKLDVWLLNRDLHDRFKGLCSTSKTCPTLTGRSAWVSGLNLNTSDPYEAEAKDFLDCVV